MTGRASITTDLWLVNQTKESFMGITTHWIKIDAMTRIWSLSSQVIAFCSVAGSHDGYNLGRYLVGLCERIGIIDIAKSESKVCC